MSAPSEEFKLPQFFTTLSVDAMFFRAATEHYERARNWQPAVAIALEAAQSLHDRAYAIPDTPENFHELVSLGNELHDRECDLATAHAPVLAALGSAHILAASATEAHINQRAKSALSGKLWDNFERMSVEAKWLFYPRLIGHESFDPGAKPYQQLCRLFGRRNALIHYKPRREPWKSFGVPSFLSALGLSLDAALESLAAVQGAISEIARILGEEPPQWLYKPTVGGFFDFDLESDEPDA